MQSLLDRGIDGQVFSPPELGCVLYLPGLPGGGSKIYDRSPYGNIGTITGATWVRLPSGLWCPSFDGTDDYVRGDNNIDWTGNLSLEMWTIPNFAHDVGSEKRIFAWQADGNNLLAFRESGGSTTTIYAIFGGTTETLSIASSFSAGDVLHYVITIDELSTTISLYRNGAFQASESSMGVHSSTKADYYIGTQAISPALYYNGKIALVRVYKYALSPFEIQNHFNREKHLFGVW